MPDEREIAQAVDQVLDPVLGREVRRARNIRLKGGFARLGVLLIPLLLIFARSPAVLPLLCFFFVIGTLCIFGPEARTSGRINRTRNPGS
jgi:hypothetical protein